MDACIGILTIAMRSLALCTNQCLAAKLLCSAYIPTYTLPCLESLDKAVLSHCWYTFNVIIHPLNRITNKESSTHWALGLTRYLRASVIPHMPIELSTVLPGSRHDSFSAVRIGNGQNPMEPMDLPPPSDLQSLLTPAPRF